MTSRKLALLVIPSEPRLTARSDSAARQLNERSIPLVHSKSQCFSSEEVCANSTYSCSGRGECIKASRAGKTCFSCSCYSTKDDAGRTVDWAGQMCEREDISVLVSSIFPSGCLALIFRNYQKAFHNPCRFDDFLNCGCD